MRAFEYSLPAVRGIQAGREYFIAMCPFALVPAMFPVKGIETTRELRAQRIINTQRVPQIARYVRSNRHCYVLSAITASVGCKVRFEGLPDADSPAATGVLHIPVDARLLLHDGVHRRAGIAEAVSQQPALANETIPLVLFVDLGLKRSEQIFTDLKGNEARAGRSSSILHDHSDELARLTRSVVARVPLFASHTEMHRTKISNRSSKLFTLSGIYQGTRLLLAGASDRDYVERLTLATEFWAAVVDNIPDWQRAAVGEMSPADLRKRYVHAHALALAAIGRAGCALVAARPKTWQKSLGRLKTLDWSRANTGLWEGRAMIAGRLSKATSCVILTANAVKQHLGITLDAEDTKIEDRVKGGKPS